MTKSPSYHSICRWTFHAGRGGFVPADIRPAWTGDRLDSAGFVRLVAEKLRPRLPSHVVLGVELHYDTEIHEANAAELASALSATGLHLAMITPGAHSHFAYGGLASLDPRELEQCRNLGRKTIELAYGPLRSVWHPDPALAPSLVIWNGSFGYDLPSIALREMYQTLKRSLLDLSRYERALGGDLFLALEPKPNEGHPAMLLPTVASALVLWHQLASEHGLDLSRRGLNMELGHSEMLGLDPVFDLVEQLEEARVMHLHLNSQGGADGLSLGGAGKFDLDYGFRPSASGLALCGLLDKAGYRRWLGHDLQPRPYDNEDQALDRVVRAILGYEACAAAAADLNQEALLALLAARETAMAEDLIRSSLHDAWKIFDRWYRC